MACKDDECPILLHQSKYGDSFVLQVLFLGQSYLKNCDDPGTADAELFKSSVDSYLFFNSNEPIVIKAMSSRKSISILGSDREFEILITNPLTVNSGIFSNDNKTIFLPSRNRSNNLAL